MLTGSHILSGNVLETRALDELLPDWKDDTSLNRTAATRDSFYFLTQRRTLRLPTPPQMRNKGKGNQIVSLRQVLAPAPVYIYLLPTLRSGRLLHSMGLAKAITDMYTQ